MNLFYILFPLIILFIQESKQELLPKEYFPLAVGNQWYYIGDNEKVQKRNTYYRQMYDYSESRQVVSEVDIRGEKFFLIVYKRLDPFDGKIFKIDSAYFAYRGTKIIKIPASKMLDSSAVITYMDFSIELNKPIRFSRNDIIYEQVLRTEGDSIITSYSSLRGGLDSGAQFSLKKGIGLFSHSTFIGGTYQLIRFVLK
jgi:hypothetical protein